MSRIKEVLEKGENILASVNIRDSKTDAWRLFTEVSKMTRMEYLMNQSEECDTNLEKSYLDLISRRCTHEPLQYIIGHQEFYGIDIKVDENVLVPRFDTEILVETALKYIKPNDKVLDMCTGSGCIICAIAKNCNIEKGTGAELSEGAIQVAKNNVKYNEIPNVEIIQTDLFANITEKYNVIVSNPPYITTSEIETLDTEVKDKEPYMALWGHDDGLYFYRKITENARLYLKEDGFLLYEIGCEQAEDVVGIMKNNGFKEIEVIKDLAGLDRVVKGRI